MAYKINNLSVTSIRNKIQMAINAALANDGLQLDIGRVTYQPGVDMRFKVTIMEQNAVSKVLAGIMPKVGETWRFGNKLYDITGFRAGRQYDYVLASREVHGRYGTRVGSYKIKLQDIQRSGVKIDIPLPKVF